MYWNMMQCVVNTIWTGPVGVQYFSLSVEMRKTSAGSLLQ